MRNGLAICLRGLRTEPEAFQKRDALLDFAALIFLLSRFAILALGRFPRRARLPFFRQRNKRR
jgi:hypothetical protein